MFDDQVVVLSAGITDPRRTVVSTVDARMAGASDTVTVSGGTSAGEVGVGGHDDLVWAHWRNETSNAQVGYRFLTPTPAQLSLDQVSGKLNDVRTANPATSITRQVFELGTSTMAGLKHDFAWALLPGASPDQARAESAVRVLSNSTSAQAVVHQGLGLTMVTTYDGRAHHVGDLKIKGAASVIVHAQDDTIEISISDPLFAQKSLSLDLSGRHELVRADRGLAVRTKPNKTEVVASTRGAQGASFTATLRRR